VRVLPVDVNHSGWKCRWENGAVRLGLRFVKGLRERVAAAASAAEGRPGAGAPTPFTSVDDFQRRARLRDDQLTKLAYAGALASLGLTRRAALWQAARVAKPAGELFESVNSQQPTANPLSEMSSLETTMADYASMELTTGPHLLTHFRQALDRDRVLSADELKRIPSGRRVTTAGAVIVRQRPGTAKGFVFLTLEDETGIAQAIVHPDLFREQRELIVSSSGLVVEGILQNSDGQCSVRAEKFWPLDGVAEVASHDFH